MRLIGLTLCLLASSFGARAESVEDRVATLEARVKALEEALHSQGANSAALNAASIDGTYQATLPSGELVRLEFNKGSVTASSTKESKTGTYEIAGQRVIISADGKSESLHIEDGHLKSDKIDFTRTK